MFVSTEQESCDLHFGVTSLTKKNPKAPKRLRIPDFWTLSPRTLNCPIEPLPPLKNLPLPSTN